LFLLSIMPPAVASFTARNRRRAADDDDSTSISGLFALPVDLQEYSNREKLNDLSMEERNRAMHDLHGVADLPKETPELLSLKREQLEVELQRRKQRDATNMTAYQQATDEAGTDLTKKQYLEKVKLQCLRADSYDVAKTASRVLRFFQLKLKLFVSTKLLPQDLGIQHLPKEDLPYLQSGFIQLLSQRDRSGRALLLMIGCLELNVPLETTVRIQTCCYFYLVLVSDFVCLTFLSRSVSPVGCF
jgi:hypothetical protein